MSLLAIAQRISPFKRERAQTEVWGKKVMAQSMPINLPAKIAIQFEKGSRKQTFIDAQIVSIFFDGVCIRKTIPASQMGKEGANCLLTHNRGNQVRRQTLTVYAKGPVTQKLVRFNGYVARFERDGVIMTVSIRFTGNRETIASALRSLR